MDQKQINPTYFNPPTMKVTMPGGFEVTIRETHGGDDDIISNLKDSQDGTAIHKYLSGIIMDNSLHPGKPTPPEEILNWRLKDKYYLLLKTRIFSLGTELVFPFTFEEGLTINFEEDLSQYDWDLSNMNNYPHKGHRDYFKYRITPHLDTGDTRTIVLSSKKIVRYEYLTGIGEKKLLQKNENDLNKNDQLRARNICLDIGGDFQPIEDFRVFSSRDMQEIRTDIERYDPEFAMNCEIENPKTKQRIQVPILTLDSFFFPLSQTNS